jgi:hypothetical protein
MDIYKLVGAQRPIGVLSAAHWPIGMCSLLGRRACYCADVHATIQGPMVHHVTSSGPRNTFSKFRGLCDTPLQVQGPVVHLLFFLGNMRGFEPLLEIY